MSRNVSSELRAKVFEISKLQKVCSGLEERVIQLKLQNSDLNQEMGQVLEANEKLTNTDEAMRKRVDVISQNLTACIAENTALKQKLDAEILNSTTEKSKLKVEIEKLARELRKEKTAFTKVRENYPDLLEQLEKLKEENKKLDESNHVKDEKITATVSVQQYKTIEQNYNAARADNEDLTMSLTNADKEIHEQKQINARLQQENKQLLNQRVNDNSTLENQIVTLKDENENLKKDVLEIQEKREKMLKVLRQNKSLVHTNEEQQNELSKTLEEYLELQSRYQKLEEDLIKLQPDYEQVCKENTTANTRILETTTALNDTVRLLEDIKLQLTTASAENEEYYADQVALEKQVERLTEEKGAVSATILSVKDAHYEALKKNDALEKQRQDAEEAVAKLENSNVQYLMIIAKLKGELQQTKA